jgi:ADP-heptose:LPS heptosyltransferase
MLDGDRAGGPWIICHPGSGSPPKNCPLDPLERVLSWKKEQGWQAIWMIGPAEMERFASQPGGAPACLSRLRQTAPVLYCEETAAAAELLAAADQYIGNDAGMTHVAAAWGVPTLALFGPTEPKVWAPLGPRVGIVRFHGSESAGDIAVRVQDALKGDLALRNEA